jgi:hypothetical protein
MFRQDGLDLPVREHRGRADRTLAPLAPRRVIALFRPPELAQLPATQGDS